MLLSKFSPAHAEAAAFLHRLSFDFPWQVSDFQSLCMLSSTKGWINEESLLVYSQVLDEMEILTVCVHPNVRHQGKGFFLLSCLIQEAEKQKVKRIFLEVSVENKAAISLYEKIGFHQIGIRRNYYRTQTGFCDALCYEKRLFPSP